MLNILFNSEESQLIQRIFEFFINHEEAFEDGDFSILLNVNKDELIDIYQKLPNIEIKEIDFCNLVANMENNIIGYPHNLPIPFTQQELDSIYETSVNNVKMLKSIKINENCLIAYGNYVNYTYRIHQEEELLENEDALLEMYIWKDEEILEFEFTNEKELIKFFLENNIIIKKEMVSEEFGSYFKNMR